MQHQNNVQSHIMQRQIEIKCIEFDKILMLSLLLFWYENTSQRHNKLDVRIEKTTRHEYPLHTVRTQFV